METSFILIHGRNALKEKVCPEYDVKEHKFYLDGVYQFDADYAGASGYKTIRHKNV